jgi:hypothetical protein
MSDKRRLDNRDCIVFHTGLLRYVRYLSEIHTASGSRRVVYPPQISKRSITIQHFKILYYVGPIWLPPIFLHCFHVDAIDSSKLKEHKG